MMKKKDSIYQNVKFESDHSPINNKNNMSSTPVSQIKRPVIDVKFRNQFNRISNNAVSITPVVNNKMKSRLVFDYQKQ